jgi:hypothetical protein
VKTTTARPPRVLPDEGPDAVDVIVLTRDGGPPPEPVRAAIAGQSSGSLSVALHVVAGTPRPGDASRFETIARARNAGRSRGTAPWVMYVDDDVVLAPGCIPRLVAGLKARPDHAALAADSLGQSCPRGEDGTPSRSSGHVGLGAILFRRDVLAFLPFRSAPDRCECRCCGDDLRRAGFAIDYLDVAVARHVPSLTESARRATSRPSAPREPAQVSPPRILCSFDRSHHRKFLRLFLRTLRACGNAEPVIAFAYGLSPTEQRLLASNPRVEAVCRPFTGVCPAISRLTDFADAAGRLPSETPLAYWDAADVVFQARLGPLWDLVRANPDRLLAARESLGILDNPMALEWVRSISDPTARRFAFDRLARRPYLNAGFAAGTARAMHRYFREASLLLRSPALRGSTDWGDQTALNLYCHTDPSRWREVPRGWNYALCRLHPRDVRMTPDGRVIVADGTPIHVAHGNAKMLPQVELSYLRD